MMHTSAPYINLHTHHTPQEVEHSRVIVSPSLLEHSSFSEHPHIYYSLGLHPWYKEILTDDSLTKMEQVLRTTPRIVALGEAGLDRVCSTDYSLQLRFFEGQIELSESLRLPLIIHLVKSQADLLRLRKLYHPTCPWVIHGFRGKAPVATQLLEKGIYLSFGRHFHPESLTLALEQKRAFLETDDLPNLSIQEVYTHACQALSLDELTLRTELYQQAQQLFK
ncbi:TatD family hydrolase, partial [Porphyromonas catoniae]